MDTVDRKTRSYIMSKIKSKSGIEILPSKYKGLYLRKHPRDIFGSPDFGNKHSKIALFMDGCFFHVCPRHFRMPQTNVEFWQKKFNNNKKTGYSGE